MPDTLLARANDVLPGIITILPQNANHEGMIIRCVTKVNMFYHNYGTH
ncbi:hypothetical protein APHCRT_1264 [Anaplasma phagocytophilum str. CRT53-1]|uniref:Uncharacterized protein n=1 Tax=Anaplasma phagocytophilum str. CRT53-1 TaxID=1359157 RepID=A0A0F3PU32_ANAPH|nr:hypothetical protein APHCRT_1264 [Anaplasma phagocytophilum str. CRT53-1]